MFRILAQFLSCLPLVTKYSPWLLSCGDASSPALAGSCLGPPSSGAASGPPSAEFWGVPVAVRDSAPEGGPRGGLAETRSPSFGGGSCRPARRRCPERMLIRRHTISQRTPSRAISIDVSQRSGFLIHSPSGSCKISNWFCEV